MATPSFSIPQPCAQPWVAMSPTAAGRHCAACATEVVDFTRLSEAEILAFLARQGGRPVCANAFAAQLAPPAPATRWRRWLLAGLTLLGWHPVASCASKPPQEPPVAAAAAPEATGPDAEAAGQQILIKGQVFDGAGTTPASQINIYINGTTFGTTTDAEGYFTLTLARGWAPIAGGKVELKFVGNPFNFKEKTVLLDLHATPRPKPLAVHLESIPNRGQVKGKIRMPEAPVAPPKG